METWGWSKRRCAKRAQPSEQPAAARSNAIGILVQGNDVTEPLRQSNRQRFLIRAGEYLASRGPDLERALRQLARAAVPDLADWVFVDLLDGASVLRSRTEPINESR